MSFLEFRTQKVTEKITRIFAVSGEMAYLVEGEERAALIDTGSGIGSMRAKVDELTDKPVTVLLTHGHVDHAMGAGEFEEVWMNHEDDYIFREHGQRQFRVDGLSMMVPPFEATEEDLLPTPDYTKFHDLNEGMRFDLGGISVEMFACPGHTLGSLVMLIPEERILMTGDACNTFTFLFDSYSTSVEEYEENLKILLPKVEGKYDRVLLSHGDGNGYPEIIQDVIAVCEDIKMGRTADLPFSFMGKPAGVIAKPIDYMSNPEIKPYGNIVYNKGRIWKSQLNG